MWFVVDLLVESSTVNTNNSCDEVDNFIEDWIRSSDGFKTDDGDTDAINSSEGNKSRDSKFIWKK